MVRLTGHLRDERLLLASSGELAWWRRPGARRHLASCETCRARQTALERTMSDLSGARAFDGGQTLPAPEPARAALARRLAQETAAGQPARLPLAAPVPDARWLYAAAVLLLAVAGSVMLFAQRRPLPMTTAEASGVFLLPRADLTPGAAAPVELQEICGPDRAVRAQPVPASVHQTIFAQYGADYGRAAEYELDYLITPELGGVPDARNLWPQPFSRTPWNAYVKDELERLFHRLVCEGRLDLEDARRQIASDWIAAYKHHFATSVPLRDYEASPLTEHDREMILAELEELGVSPATVSGRDGPALLAMLRSFREQAVPAPPPVGLELALFTSRR